MKKIKNIVLAISLVLNVFMFVYAVTQNLEAQRNLKLVEEQTAITMEARETAAEQRALAEQNAMLAKTALAEAERQRLKAEEQLSKK